MSELKKTSILAKLRKSNPEAYKKMMLDEKRRDLRHTERRLNVLFSQFEQAEHAINEAIQRHEKHNVDTRRLKKLQDVLPKMRAVITRELEALLPD